MCAGCESGIPRPLCSRSYLPAISHTSRFFIGLGTGPHVPKFLRIAGKVRNRELKKGEVEAFVKQVWAEHAEYEVGGPPAGRTIVARSWSLMVMLHVTGQHQAEDQAHRLFLRVPQKPKRDSSACGGESIQHYVRPRGSWFSRPFSTHVDVCVPPSATLWRNTLQMLTWSCSCFAWPGLFPMPPTTTK